MPPTTPSTDIAAWRGLARVQGDVRRGLGAALESGHGLSLWDYTVLRTLAEQPKRRMRMTELARAVDYTPSGLTRLVGRLEGAGLVERYPCPDDGRGFIAWLTAEGHRVFVRARRTHVAGVRRLFLDLCTPDELETMVRVWERISPGCTGVTATPGPRVRSGPPG